MGLIVPSDLLEYPIINYFKYRNKGKLSDEALSPTLISPYTRYYRKNPRVFFNKNFKKQLLDMKWSKPYVRGPFFRSTGQIISPYQPLSSILQESKYHPVLHLITHKYQHKDVDGKKDPHAAILFIHGYAENTFFFHENSYFRLFHRIFQSDIFSFELPYHFHRQPSDSPFSGAYYLSGNPIRMLEAIRQSLQEILLLIQYLKDSYERVILFGISLGGHLVSLATQFLEDVDIIAALSSPFLFNINPKIVPVSTELVSQLKKNHHTNWYRILWVCNLKYFAPFTTNRHTAIIGGRYDRIVPFSRVQSLAKMINKPLFGYPGGHLSLLVWLRSLLCQINCLFTE